MTDQPSTEEQDNPFAIDFEKLTQEWADIGERSGRIMQAFLERQGEDGGFNVPDAGVVTRTFMDLGAAMWSNPDKMIEAQSNLWKGYAQLWDETAKRMQGEAAHSVVEPKPDDKRFKDEAWTESVIYDYIKQSYLLASNWVQDTVHDVDGVDEQTRRKVDFYTRQVVNALSPTNFVATNPKVLQKTLETKGENLSKGLKQLLQDLENGRGSLRISMTDSAAFKMGENIAATPCKVVYQNDLMQLLQYEPSTETVGKTPILITPPWINKFYVMDLQPKNSLIKWAVDQGHTVFVISWVNPDRSLSHKSFDDYMLEGPIAAMDAIEKATGSKKVNIAGYCIGGTLTACTLGYLAATGKQDRVASATFFTTMVDFEDPGELKVFIDDEQITLLEEQMNKKGYLDGQHMSTVFSMMRDNDLIWSFVVNNYLLGRDPMPFDLLYWNADNTRMPAMMHGKYLREFYLENKLKDPGGIAMNGKKIDLGKVTVPCYLVAAKEDHIAPWKSCYKATQLYGGPVRFVLGGSGHIAGIINPPAKQKYGYQINTRNPASPDTWLKGAKQHEGSWWTDWDDWLSKFRDGEVKARKPGSGKLKVVQDGPGDYVQVRLGP